MLARVLKRLGVPSTRFVIATKVGHFPGTAEHAYEAAHIRHQCEQSLINLQRDYIDLYYFHHGDFGANDKYLPDAVETMNALVKEGKVRIKGLSAYSADDFERLAPIIQPQVLQGSANALNDQYIRVGGRVDNLMKARGLSFVAFAPLARGRLLDKFDPNNPPVFEPGDHRRDKEEYSAKSLAALKPKLEKLKTRFGSSTEDLAAFALQYVLNHPRVACAIPGFRNPRQAKCNVIGANRRLSAEDVAFVRAAIA
jgi:aryl-alcohol dehydrogenase-like predicted oxidoreductase